MGGLRGEASVSEAGGWLPLRFCALAPFPLCRSRVSKDAAEEGGTLSEANCAPAAAADGAREAASAAKASGAVFFAYFLWPPKESTWGPGGKAPHSLLSNYYSAG